MSSATVNPGKVWSSGEAITLGKLNATATPTVAIPSGTITATELSSSVNAALAAVSSAIVSSTAKSASFAILSGDKGKMFDVTCGASDVTATMPAAATTGNGWYVWLRKADTGSGKVLTSPITSPTATALVKQEHTMLILSDGTNYIVAARVSVSVDATTGLVTLSATGNLLLAPDGGLINIGQASGSRPALKANTTTLAVRKGDDTGDAPVTCSDLTASGRARNSADVAIIALDIDWATGNSFYKTLSANSTFTFSNLADGQTIVVALTNTAGNYTVTWPAVSWVAATAPVQTIGAKTDVYTFKRSNGTIYGVATQNF